MANIQNGILGMVLGQIGPVTAYKRNGINVVRIATRKKDNVITPGRLSQREKIKLCSEFTRAFTGSSFFRKTFPPYGHTGTGLHRATSAIMNLAIDGVYPHLSLHYPAILISKGPLPPAINAQARRDAHNNIEFSWNDNSATGTAGKKDRCVLLAYCPALRQAVFTIGNGCRQDRSATLRIDQLLSGAVHVWMGFLNDSEKDASDSTYCGFV